MGNTPGPPSNPLFEAMGDMAVTATKEFLSWCASLDIDPVDALAAVIRHEMAAEVAADKPPASPDELDRILGVVSTGATSGKIKTPVSIATDRHLLEEHGTVITESHVMTPAQVARLELLRLKARVESLDRDVREALGRIDLAPHTPAPPNSQATRNPPTTSGSIPPLVISMFEVELDICGSPHVFRLTCQAIVQASYWIWAGPAPDRLDDIASVRLRVTCDTDVLAKDALDDALWIRPTSQPVRKGGISALSFVHPGAAALRLRSASTRPAFSIFLPVASTFASGAVHGKHKQAITITFETDLTGILARCVTELIHADGLPGSG